MQKLDGVESARVSLKDGLTILDLKPSNRITLAEVRQVIKRNGFVSKDAQVVARGEPKTIDGRRIFEVLGTDEKLTLEGEPERVADTWKLRVKSE